MNPHIACRWEEKHGKATQDEYGMKQMRLESIQRHRLRLLKHKIVTILNIKL